MAKNKKKVLELVSCKVTITEEVLRWEFEEFLGRHTNDEILQILKNLIVWSPNNRTFGCVSEKVIRDLNKHLTKVLEKWDQDDRKRKSDDYI